MSKSESTNQREKGIDSELEEANIVDWAALTIPSIPKTGQSTENGRILSSYPS